MKNLTNEQASQAYRDAYNSGRPLVDDFAYDAMFDSNEAALDDAGQGKLVEHLHPMLSLPTFFFDIDNLSDDMLKTTGMTIGTDLTLSFKLDGVPCSCWLGPNGWQKAVTRGKRVQGFVANDVFLSILPQPKQLPTNGLIDFRGEFVLSYADYEAINSALPETERYANPRSMVAAQLNSLKPNLAIVKAMKWFAHGIWINDVPSDHFKMLKHWLSDNDICFNQTIPANIMDRQSIIGCIKQVYNEAMRYVYPCDGVVIQYRQTMDNNGRCNLDRIAIKQMDEAKFSAETKVSAIEWRLANNGSYFPRLHFEPVTINGSEVTHAAGYCWDYLQRLGLSIGASVVVTMRGGVIPYVSRVLSIGNGDYQLPTDAAQPEPGDMQLWSMNSEDAVQRLRFIRGMEMLDLQDCGVQLFNDMYDLDFKNLFVVAKAIKDGTFRPTMYRMLPATEASQAKLRTIEDRFRTFNYVWMILALRENGIGFKAANAIGQYLTGYELRDKRILNNKAVKAFLAKSDVIDMVKQYSNPVLPEHADLAVLPEVNITLPEHFKPKACMSKKPTNGMKKAEFAKAYLADYDITENIREANVLICPAGEQSNKIAYAKAHGIEIRTYDSFIA